MFSGHEISNIVKTTRSLILSPPINCSHKDWYNFSRTTIIPSAILRFYYSHSKIFPPPHLFRKMTMSSTFSCSFFSFLKSLKIAFFFHWKFEKIGRIGSNFIPSFYFLLFCSAIFFYLGNFFVILKIKYKITEQAVNEYVFHSFVRENNNRKGSILLVFSFISTFSLDRDWNLRRFYFVL